MGGFETLLDALETAVHGIGSDAGLRVGLWLVAYVLLWSGVSKLRRPHAAALAMANFRVASSARPTLGRALGAAEVLLGLALIGASLAGGDWIIGVAGLAAALFGIFAFLIGRALRDGERFACACFGDGGGELSPWTLLRAAGLCVLSIALAVAGLSVGSVEGSLEAALLPGVIAGAAPMIVLIGAAAPALLRWNADPFDRDDRVRERRYAR